jgi:hypothetical protein
MIVHGLADDDVLYEGGVSRHRGGTRTYWSIEESVKFWVMNNGCKQKAASTCLREGSIHRKSRGGCRNNSDVALLLIKGWGHVWPGPYFTSDLAKKQSSQGFRLTTRPGITGSKFQHFVVVPQHATADQGIIVNPHNCGRYLGGKAKYSQNAVGPVPVHQIDLGLNAGLDAVDAAGTTPNWEQGRRRLPGCPAGRCARYAAGREKANVFSRRR